MGEKRDATHTAGAAGAGGCGRAEELVTYLYGEATPEEARLFRGHLDACAVCRHELTALGGVRGAVGAWRAEALGSIPALNIQEALAPAAKTRRATARRRSASAALREFFSLSPTWLRAGAAAALLAVCALTALTLARAEVRWGADGLAFRAGVAERVMTVQAEAPAPTGYSDEQVDAIVARKVAEAKAQLAVEAAGRMNESRPEQVINVAGTSDKSSRRADGPPAARRRRTARRSPEQGDSLLADDNLPRLSDLLSGSY